MTWGTYGAYVLFVLLVLIVPGPDTALVLKNSLAGGRRGGVLTALGIGSGNLAQGVAAALGLSAVIVRSEPVFLTLRWAGAAYLGYLGVKALIAAWRGDYSALTRTNRVVGGGGVRVFSATSPIRRSSSSTCRCCRSS